VPTRHQVCVHVRVCACVCVARFFVAVS
jgi:hypothetical protein